MRQRDGVSRNRCAPLFSPGPPWLTNLCVYRQPRRFIQASRLPRLALLRLRQLPMRIWQDLPSSPRSHGHRQLLPLVLMKDGGVGCLGDPVPGSSFFHPTFLPFSFPFFFFFPLHTIFFLLLLTWRTDSSFNESIGIFSRDMKWKEDTDPYFVRALPCAKWKRLAAAGGSEVLPM